MLFSKDYYISVMVQNGAQDKPLNTILCKRGFMKLLKWTIIDCHSFVYCREQLSIYVTHRHIPVLFMCLVQKGMMGKRWGAY